MQPNREPWIFALTLASAAAVMVSIAAAQILLAGACALWLIAGPRKIVLPRYFVPLCAFMATTVLSLAMSAEPGAGGGVVRKFVLFSMGFLAVNFVTGARRAEISMTVLLAVAASASLYAVAQFGFAYQRFLETGQLADDPMILARITGPMSHWMTFSGEQLLAWCAAVPAIMVLGRAWLVPLTVIGAALILSFTQGAWIGALAGTAGTALLAPRRLLVAVLLPVALVAAGASGLIYHRISKSFGKEFAPVSSRLEMILVGSRMINDHPWFGVGPERVSREFVRYYDGSNLTNFYYGHLHNNFLQIAAERGLLCLGAFLWLIVAIYGDLIRMLKTGTEHTRWAVVSAIAALTGFVVAGLFEYNFGDSEVLMLLLFIVSVPYGISSRNEETYDPGPKLHSNVGSYGVPV